MVEGGGRAGLLDEAPAAGVVRHAVGAKHLEGHFAAEPRIAGAVDLSHASEPHERDDLVRPEPRAGRETHG